MKSFAPLILIVTFAGLTAFSSPSPEPDPRESRWVDSVLQGLGLEEKVGQLFILATYSNKDETEYRYVERLIREEHLGGLIFMQGTPSTQTQLVNRYQAAARVPLLMGQDAEWGLDMRLEGSPGYPRNMTLGAIRNDSLLYELGQQMASDLRRVGITLNFAPVLDVNNNPRNPVINFRSFGENKYNVARKGLMVARGMADGRVIPCAKHFPGHGDTDADSHYDLPVISHDLTRLDTLELYPFMKAIQAGIPAVMVAHLYVPALDPTPNQATTLSPRVVQGLLRDSLDYDGLVITDALNMKGVTKFYPPGEVALRAFLAGNDLLLFPEDLPRSARLIRQAVAAGRVPEAELDRRVRRILRAKYRLGLGRWERLPEAGVQADLDLPAGKVLRRKLYEAAITIPRNEQQLLPLRRLEERKIAYVQIGGSSDSPFYTRLRTYAGLTPFYLRQGFSRAEMDQVLARLQGYNTAIVGLFDMSPYASRNFGVKASTEMLCEELARRTDLHTVLTLFGSPYALRTFGQEEAIVMAYEEVPEAQEAAAAAIFGGIPVSGRLPVTASDQFKEGMGYSIRVPVRFGYADPEGVGMDSRLLRRIDSLAQTYIRRGAMPGCEILVMREGKIVYDKGFGRTEYVGSSPRIDPYDHIYDLASLTKVAATTLATMALVERGQLDLDVPIHTYLPDLAQTNKAQITIRQLLQHNARLPAWHPFYRVTYANPQKKILDPRYYSYSATRSAQLAVAPGLYGTEDLPEVVWQQIRELDLRPSEGVRYSDIGMIILGKILEARTGKPLDELSRSLFFDPMGMARTGFNPHEHRLTSLCPPTESDTEWRQTVVQGYVHDPTAAMLGGVAGHAGLFSNVYDLAKLLLMLERGGLYGDRRFLKKETIAYFTRKQLATSRRGLGWDKPETDMHASNPASAYSSAGTFGHTGFTGTCMWVDPAYDLVFIFLSNRTYPKASNRLLLHEDVRSRMLDQVYLSIGAYQAQHRHP
ncbi:MAG: hypothetical protein D6722_17560 [Bacteroidetes bacterium]|nr:MAG: hypothetical protein D6722_17560 [Bacteroidota bacterium]